MHYVEMIRARRILTIYGCVLLAFIVITEIGLASVHHHANGESVHSLPFSAVLFGCGVAAMFMAPFFALQLGAEASTAAISWTRPMRREAIAWRFIAVDVVALVLVYAMTVAAAAIVIVLLGFTFAVFADARIGVAIALSLGCTLLWYALVVLASTRLPATGGWAAMGLSWVAFGIVYWVGTLSAPDPLHALFVGLNYVNPLALFGNHGRAVHPEDVVPFAVPVRAAMAWGFAILAAATSVRLWSTREV